MITFITDQRSGEPDILSPNKSAPLRIFSLDGIELSCVAAPTGGWTHEDLLGQARSLEHLAQNGADAYLGDAWVGSTEV